MNKFGFPDHRGDLEVIRTHNGLQDIHHELGKSKLWLRGFLEDVGVGNVNARTAIGGRHNMSEPRTYWQDVPCISWRRGSGLGL